MKRVVLNTLLIVSALLGCAVVAGWIMGYGGDPVELWRISLKYDFASGGRMRTEHVGTWHAGTYWIFTSFPAAAHSKRYRLLAGRSEWHCGRAWTDWSENQLFVNAEYFSRTFPVEPRSSTLGFNFYRQSFPDNVINPDVSGIVVVTPDWFLLFLTCLGPAIWLRRWHRKRNYQSAGRCTSCGYDLSKSSERCPECGEPIENAA